MQAVDEAAAGGQSDTELGASIRGALAEVPMIDRPVVARGMAAVQDAATRIRETLPAEPEDLAADRTKREVVVLNLFVAIQECLSLATHRLADEGRTVPATYAEVFRALAEHHVIDPGLASRMAAAAGLRNLIAHRYGDLDWARVHEIGTHHLSDRLEFCKSLQRSISEEVEPDPRGGE